MFIDSRLGISPQTEGSSCSTFELNKTPLVTNDDRPFHPPQNFVFPKKQQDKQKRSCQAKWHGYITTSKMILFFVLTA